MPALFERDGDDVVATVLTQGPWSPDAQYGGAPCGLLTAEIERIPTLVPMRIARLTFDMHRPVPVDRLHVRTEVVREGKRLQLVAATITHAGVEVARCTALRLRLGDGPDLNSDPRKPVLVPPRPPGEERWDFTRPDGSSSGFLGAVEVARIGEDLSPAWYRMTQPIVDGEVASPLVNLATVSDFTSNSANYLDHACWASINPDLTLDVVRPPVGEWFAVDTRSWYETDGIGHSRADLFDEQGFVATCTMMTLVDRR